MRNRLRSLTSDLFVYLNLRLLIVARQLFCVLKFTRGANGLKAFLFFSEFSKSTLETSEITKITEVT